MKHYFRNSSHTINSNKKGFTLLELMIIISIISSLIIVSFKGLLIAKENSDLSMAAHRIEATLKECQSCAMYDGCNYKIEFYPNLNRYRVFRDSAKIKDVELKNINLHYTNYTDYKVRFNKNGTPSMGGTVTLKTKYGKTLYVIMTPVTARTRISSTPPDNW